MNIKTNTLTEYEIERPAGFIITIMYHQPQMQGDVILEAIIMSSSKQIPGLTIEKIIRVWKLAT